MFRRSTKIFLLLFFTIIVLSTVIDILLAGPTFHGKVNEVYDAWNKCVMEQFQENNFNATEFWYKSPIVFDRCRNVTGVSEHFNVQEFENKDEVKLYALPIRMDGEEKSVHLSLGVGHDIEAELKVKTVLPNSLFFGADPESAVNEKIFSSHLGPFFPTAIGNASGVFEALVLPETAASLTDYHKRKVKKIDVTYLIKNYVKHDFFDNVFIDIEFDEYNIFPYFRRNGVLERTNVVFCQFNIEIHEGNLRQKEQFRRFVDQLLNDKRYLIYQDFLLNHHRLFLIDFENQKCLNKYFK